MRLLWLSLTFLALVACVGSDLKSTYSDLFINKNEIIAVSTNGRDVVSYDPETGATKQLTAFDRVTDRARGVYWLDSTHELLVAIDGRDRIIAVDAIDGTARDFVVDSQFNGTPRGLTQLENGDILAIESNNIERFTSQGLRITSGTWPLAINGGYQIKTLSTGNFLICAGGTTDEVRIYDSSGVLQAQDAGPGGHDARGCTELPDGRIAVSWNGANDQIWLYDSSLASGSAIVLNTNIGNIMPNPSGMATSKDGTLLVSDLVYNHIIEFNASGTLIKTFGVFNDATDIYVIP